MHPNLKLLSHSSILSVHSCPRRYELTKLLWKKKEESIHFDFGKVVGIGVQEYMMHRDGPNPSCAYNRAVFSMFMNWNLELDNDEGERQGKTFWGAMVAIDTFMPIANSIFATYEVAVLDGKPASELGFSIDCGNGFSYRGFVDLLLKDKIRPKLVVIENKTTGSYRVDEASFKNSGQGLGYSLVLEAIVQMLQLPEEASWEVYYPVYLSRCQTWEILRFVKNHTTRALWIKNLLIDIKRIADFGEMDYFPMYGESCIAFGKQCKFFGLCEMKTEHLVGSEIEPIEEDPSKYQFHFSLADIVEQQLSKFSQES